MDVYYTILPFEITPFKQPCVVLALQFLALQHIGVEEIRDGAAEPNFGDNHYHESKWTVLRNPLCGQWIGVQEILEGWAEPFVVEKGFFIDNLLVRIPSIIVMIRGTGLAP